MSGGIQHFPAQFALRGGDVHEQVPSGEPDGPGGQRGRCGAGIQRCEPVAAQGCQSGGSNICGVHRPARAVEIQAVADDQATAAHGLHVARVPRLGVFADREKRGAIGAVPVEAVAGEAGEHLVALVEVQRLARLVVRSLPDGEEPHQQAFIGEHVQIVELRRQVAEARIRVTRVEAIRAHPRLEIVGQPIAPGDLIRVLRPGQRGGGGLALEVVPQPVHRFGRSVIVPAHARDPHAAEGIPEECGPVPGRAGDHELLRPLAAVGRSAQGHMEGRFLGAGLEELEPLRRVGGVVVQPDRGGVAVGLEDDIGAQQIERRAGPVQPVLGERQTGAHRGGAIPHHEGAVLRLIPYAVAERGGEREQGALFPNHLRPQHRRAGVIFRAMKPAVQGGGLDQEIVHEQLAADIHGNHRRRLREVRHGHWLARSHLLGRARRRPRAGKHDAVVERFGCPNREEAGNEQQGEWQREFHKCFQNGCEAKVEAACCFNEWSGPPTLR